MKITTHCFAITGLFCNPPWTANAGFVTGSEITLVVDSSLNSHSAATIYGYAHNVKPENKLLLINTEKHFDHIGGNYFFSQKNVEIYGHEKIIRTEQEFSGELNFFNEIITEPLRKELNEGKLAFNNTRIKTPDVKITSNTSFELGNLIAEVLLTPGHTQSNLSIYIPSDGVLYSGDCIVNEYYPNLLAGSKPDWEDWLKSLELISKLDLNYIVPGHGEVITGAKIIHELSRITNILKEHLEHNQEH